MRLSKSSLESQLQQIWENWLLSGEKIKGQSQPKAILVLIRREGLVQRMSGCQWKGKQRLSQGNGEFFGEGRGLWIRMCFPKD